MPEHDGAFDATAELRVAEQAAVAVHEVAAEPRPTDDLGDERPPAGVRQRLGAGPGIRAGDHHGARSAHEHMGVAVGIGRQVRLADATAALVQRARRLDLDRILRGDVGPDGRGVQLELRRAEPRRQAAASGRAAAG